MFTSSKNSKGGKAGALSVVQLMAYIRQQGGSQSLVSLRQSVTERYAQAAQDIEDLCRNSNADGPAGVRGLINLQALASTNADIDTTDLLTLGRSVKAVFARVGEGLDRWKDAALLEVYVNKYADELEKLFSDETLTNQLLDAQISGDTSLLLVLLQKALPSAMQPEQAPRR